MGTTTDSPTATTNQPSATTVPLAATYEVPYPFVLDAYVEHDHDGETWVEPKVPSWRPGTRCDNSGYDPHTGDWFDYSADGMGTMVLTVVSIHKPGRYPTRVFFTREWIDPDGKRFGKRKLRILSQSAFTALRSGFRHEYGMLRKQAVAKDSGGSLSDG